MAERVEVTCQIGETDTTVTYSLTWPVGLAPTCGIWWSAPGYPTWPADPHPAPAPGCDPPSGRPDDGGARRRDDEGETA